VPIIDDYLDWNISAVATYGNFSLTAGYTDTDLDGVTQTARFDDKPKKPSD